MSGRDKRRRPPAATPAGAPWLAVGLLAALAVALYATSVNGPFVFDDIGAIANNPTIRQFGVSTLRGIADTAVAGRPLVNLSLALNYAVTGPGPGGFHVVNIALHAACGILLFLLLRRAFAGMPGPRAEGMALAAAALWIAHPINSEAVDYLTQRTELMMAACYLLALLSAAQGRVWMAIAAGMAGAFCKESIATLPIAVMLWDRAFGFDSFAAAFRARWRLYAGLASIWVILAAMLLAGAGQSRAAGFATAGTSSWNYLLNQPSIVLRYFWLLIWPRDLVIYYGWPRAGLSLSAVWPQGLVVTVALVAAVVAFVRWPRPGLAALMCFVLLAPTSSFIPIATEVGAERRMYLPSMAIAALAVAAGSWVIRRRNLSRAAAVGLVAALVLALGARTIARAAEYRSALSLAETTLARWPTPYAHQLVGVELAAAGRHDDAIPHLRQAVAAFPTAHFYLGVELLKTRHVDDGISELQAFLAVERIPEAVRQARLLLARAYASKQDSAAAEQQAAAIVSAAPGDPEANGLMADLLAARQAFADAVPFYQRYLASRPSDPRAWSGLGVALAASGDLTNAVGAFQRAVDADPANPEFRANLARAIQARADRARASGR